MGRGCMKQVGYGLIETMRVRRGRIPFLDRHLARLERSRRELGLPQPSQEVTALVTASEPHEPYPHKTTQRDCFVDAAAEAVVAEADDALLLTHEGWVAEGTVWNVFWWDHERLRTPAAGLGILPGIGRERVLELAQQVEEGRYPRPALEGNSLFLTNAVRGVVPLGSLDGVPVPADERTADLARGFWPD